MTTISAEVIADSVSPGGVRIVTFQLCYPRWIHAELLTHRAFCRNASSSRATPIKRMNAMIEDNPALPLHLGLNQKGMQAFKQVTDPADRKTIYSLWKSAMRPALRAAVDMLELFGVAKQVANRVTEPFQHMNVVLTATDYDNFLALRCHPMAEPHLRCLAWLMADGLYQGSTPAALEVGDWHLPYVRPDEFNDHPLEHLKKFSAARCARVSYKLHDGKEVTPEKDLALYDRLVAGLEGDDPLEPGHLSPFEHPAVALEDPEERSGPLRGWGQYRKEFTGENMSFDYETAVSRGWREEALSILDQEMPPLM